MRLSPTTYQHHTKTKIPTIPKHAIHLKCFVFYIFNYSNPSSIIIGHTMTSAQSSHNAMAPKTQSVVFYSSHIAIHILPVMRSFCHRVHLSFIHCHCLTTYTFHSPGFLDLRLIQNTYFTHTSTASINSVNSIVLCPKDWCLFIHKRGWKRAVNKLMLVFILTKNKKHL